MSEKKNWIVRMRCVVTKDVYLEDCTEDEARNNPWDHATEDQEVEQVDWEVQRIKVNEGQRMKVIYIAGPYRGKNAWVVEDNVRVAENAAIEVAKLGAMPQCPHTMTRFWDGTMTDAFWLEGTMELLKRCDALFLCPRWGESQGSRAEYAYALSVNMPVFVTMEGVKEWLKTAQA